MGWIIWVLAIAVYLAIGAFICGLANDEQAICFYMTLWPLLGVGYVLMKLSEIPVNLGFEVRMAWRKYKRNKEKKL